MLKNKVSVSQLALLILLVMMGGKFLTLPSILAEDVGHDSWLVICFAFLWDAICLAFLLWAVKINTSNLSFDGVVNLTLSKWACKPILIVFFVLFVSKIIVLLDSCYKTFAVTFDVNTNWILFVIPIMAVAGFAIYRGFNSIARVSQVLFALIILSIIAILIYPITKTQFASLTPIGEAGWGNIVGTAFNHSFWFSDYIFIYFVFGDIKRSKKLFSPIFVSFSVGVAMTVLLNAVFVALFGSFAPNVDIAMSKIGLFALSTSSVGRWDWLTFTVWLTSVIIKVIVYTFCAYRCIEKLFERYFGGVNLFVMGALTLLLMLPMFISATTFVQTFVQWCILPFALVQYLLPLLMPLLTGIATKKSQKEVVTNEQS